MYAQGVKVLIIDHDPVEVKRLREIIEQSGHQVWTASTGVGALQIAELEQPYLAIVDTRLPDFSGMEVLRQIRLNPRTRPMCVVLANPDPKDEEIFFGYGYYSDGHWQRPVEWEELVRFLSRVAPGADEPVRLRDRFAGHYSDVWDAERENA